MAEFTSLPSHEGSGLKSRAGTFTARAKSLPSHEGSGLKSDCLEVDDYRLGSPLA